MKILLNCFALALLVALAFSSCKKEDPYDPCDDTTCFNGGVCDDGSCDCPPGFSGVECQVADPCYNITCINNGVCINGTCDCPPGYTGSNCAIRLEPTSMTITRIVISDYPVIQSTGAGWDVSDGADAYITHGPGQSANANYYVSLYWPNVTGETLNFSDVVSATNLPYTVTNLTSSHTLGMWDYDATSSDDFMAGIYYTPRSRIVNSFPTSFELSTSAMTARIYITWNF